MRALLHLEPICTYTKDRKKKKGRIPKINARRSSHNSTLINVRNIYPSNKEDVETDEDDDDFEDVGIDQEHSVQNNSTTDYFCGEPSHDYARVVLSSSSGKNLFTHDSLLSMCRLEHEILIGSGRTSNVNKKYKELCQPSKTGECCRSWSIPNYIALLANHSSCLNISQEDINQAIYMLNRCAPVYYKKELFENCKQREDSPSCQSYPEECLENNWAYNIFHFLADKEFMNPRISVKEKNIPFLRYAMVILPMASSTATMQYYYAIKSTSPLKFDGIQIEAMELGLRDRLFDQHLLQDSWLLIGVAVAIGICMWLYSGSCLIAMASIISIPLSLGLSYAAYKYIFRLTFFPFLNMVAAVISLGIGVDDAFIFCKMWKFLKQNAEFKRKNRTPVKSSEIDLQNQLYSMETLDGQPEAKKATYSSVDGESNVDESASMKSEARNQPPTDPLPNAGDRDVESISIIVGNTQGTLVTGSQSANVGSQRNCVSYKFNYASKHGSEEWLVCETLRRSFQSMFVTSFTTAAAFYFSYFSKVTAIRCFSIFAGTAVITNFVLMLTWFPAAVVIAERWMNVTCLKSYTFPENISCSNPVSTSVVSQTLSSASFPRLVYQKFLQFLSVCDSKFVISKRWAIVLVISLGMISLSSVVIATYFPGLHPPNELQFQLLHSSHLFERYHLVLRPFFNFEQELTAADPTYGQDFGIPMHFVFGVLPIDQGDPLDPSSRVPRGLEASNLHLDSNFDLSSRQGQRWLLRFCQSIRAQKFYGSNSGPLLSNCFIETFKKWMSRRCIDPVVLGMNIFAFCRSPCCESSNFPFSRKVFRKCLLRALAQLHKTPHLLFYHKGEAAGPRFLKTKPHKMIAAVIEYESKIPFTTSFTVMDEFYNSVESWMEEQMKSAPKGLRNGWFVSNLHFYDLQFREYYKCITYFSFQIQRTLSTGVLTGVCISLGVSALTLLVFTCNIIRSMLTAISIASATSVTLAVLSLLGWSLGPVESLTLSLAVGLSADFALHYAICHQKSKETSQRFLKKCKSSAHCASFISSCRRSIKICAQCKRSKETADSGCSDVEEGCDIDGDDGGPFVGVPATLAAITTAAAGVLMLPSSVVAYTQVGVFLIVLMVTSWFYSTFFLLSLL
ncbi:hypothetical protein J437_LFUL000572, partial [Ladona fulva]